MLVFNMTYALLIALAFGICGIPLSFWLFRKDRYIGIISKTVFGYAFGFMLVPLALMIESMFGILFSRELVIIDWLIIFISGIALILKEKMKFEVSSAIKPNKSWIGVILVVGIMSSVFMIGMSAAGGIIYELDPYFYLEAAKQVVVYGKNFIHDDTAWYPLASQYTSHMGNPMWNYAIASWYSLYGGSSNYSPYTLAAIGSIYPPLVGALTAFSMFFLFRSIYGQRTGILASGLIAFMPAMLIKFQGGDAQIEPYNIFSLILFFSAIIYAFRNIKQKESLIFVAISYSAIVFASNLSSLITFGISIFIFLISISQTLQPSNNNRERREFLFKLVGIMIALEFVYTLYLTFQAFDLLIFLKLFVAKASIPIFALVAPLAFEKMLGFGKVNMPMLAKAGTLLIILLVFLLISLQLPGIKDLMNSYLNFGAYTLPLHRTIAEQAPGSEFYQGSFGAIAAPLTGNFANPSNDIVVGALSLAVKVIGAINILPTMIVNGAYSAFGNIMNVITDSNFEIISKGNSLMTFFLFFGTSLLAARFIYKIIKTRPWSVTACLFLPFIISVSLVAFGKQKLVMYLGIVVVFSVGIFWGESEKVVRILWKKLGKHLNGIKFFGFGTGNALGILSAMGVIALVAMQFGTPAIFAMQLPGTDQGPLYHALSSGYGYKAQTLLFYSFTPKFIDNPENAKIKLESYCRAVPQDVGVCEKVKNWNRTLSNPSDYYSRELCIRSLWPNLKQPENEMGMVFGYRCSALNNYWIDAMEWIKKNVDDRDRVISWWDYGHWINYFGLKKTVLRNEHLSEEMIERTAYAYVHGDVDFLIKTMNEYGSKTALFDIEILGSGQDKYTIAFGGKYGALNYLGCAYTKETSVEFWPGQSACERNNLWETIVIPTSQEAQKPCFISEETGLMGVEAYLLQRTDNQNARPIPKYCMTKIPIEGKMTLVAYNLDKKYENGDLKLQRAFWRVVGDDGQFAMLSAIYTKDKVWKMPNGNVTDGWEDRTTKFYDSNLYSAFMLGELKGFDLVYSSPQIRIFQMKDQFWEGYKKPEDAPNFIDLDRLTVR